MELRNGARRYCQRLVLVPGPQHGHITPMIQLGSILHSKGFSITIAHTNVNSPNPSDNPDFAFHPLSDNLSENDVANPGPALVETLNANCKAKFHDYLAQMMAQQQELSDDQVVGVIHDHIMYFASAAAKSLKLPCFIFRATSASFMLADLAIPRLHEQGYIPLQESRQQELVPELCPFRFKDLPLLGTVEKAKRRLAIAINTGYSAIIWNTMDHLEHTSLTMLQDFLQVPMYAIGPLHKITSTRSTSFLKEDTSCIEWLDKQAPKSVIYTSFGSGAIMEEKELVETAWGLANSDQPFLWVVRPGSVRGSEWIELLPEGFIEKVGPRGCVVKWAPQEEVLAHGAVGGFWSHCGWNSILEGVSEGVPMICRPRFCDQTVNARLVTYVWKVGLELDQVLERGEIANVVRRLMVDKEGEEVRLRAIEMKEKVKACMQEGGSSHKSFNDLADLLSSPLPI